MVIKYMAENKIYDDGIESFSKLTVLGENLLIFCMIIIGVIGMLPFQLYYLPIISIIYLLFSLVMLFFLLRKHLCTNCYYYNKWCHCGWGKLASLIFKKHTGNQNLGGKLANITWAFIMILPIVIMINILILNLYQFYNEL